MAVRPCALTTRSCPVFPGPKASFGVQAERIFPNCPRYIHRMKLIELSVYVPAAGHQPPVPAWKQNPAFKDTLPRHD
jgi:hypothetical protein